MELEMKKENTLKYPNFTHLFFVCVVLTACAVRGLAEPTDQVNQQEVNDEEKIQQKAREEYAGLWRIETITSKGDTTEPDKRITIDNKTDGTWVLFIDGKELSSGTNSFTPLCDPKEIDISITGGEGQGKDFCREFMRLRSRSSDSVFEVVVVRDQIVLSHFMVTKVLS